MAFLDTDFLADMDRVVETINRGSPHKRDQSKSNSVTAATRHESSYGEYFLNSGSYSHRMDGTVVWPSFVNHSQITTNPLPP